MCKQEIVLSGINLFEGGPLSVYKDFVNAIVESGVLSKYRLILFVHKKELFREFINIAEIIELPRSRSGYLWRLYYEYIFFKTFSKKRDVEYWISLHDITPNVKAKHLYTYCHQPAPFYKPGKFDWKYGKKICLFAYFYKFLYKKNIKRNTAVIVQQDWIREEFRKRNKIDNIIVAKPNIKIHTLNKSNYQPTDTKYTFIYASFPRTFKNFEIICEACKLIEMDKASYRVILTLDGTENAYSRYLRDRYGKIQNIEWIGLKPRDELFEIYNKCDCLIFPSKLETWGLPISEFKQTGKPIILADLPYAHETIGNYDKAFFFNPLKSIELAEVMKKAIDHNLHFLRHVQNVPKSPYVETWKELVDMILNNKEESS